MTTHTPFAARSYQKEAIDAFDAGKRRFVTVWHRRAGKDRTWLAITIRAMLQRRGVYFHIFPSLNQGRRDLWDNIVEGTPFLSMFDGLVVDKNETEMQIKIKGGSIWQIMGADDQRSIERLRGPNPVGLVYSEYGTMLAGAWTTLSPVLAENGGWAAFAYTPPDILPTCCASGEACGGNHGKQRYERALTASDWFCSLRTVDQTTRDGADEGPRSGERVITNEALDAERRDGKTEWFIRREYYCVFDTPVEGSYYGDLVNDADREGRICNLDYDPAVLVRTAWDLGATFDTMTIGCHQDVGREIRWIDALSGTGRGMPHYVHELKENRKYIYSGHDMPHDADAHEISTGKKRVATARDLGLHNIKVLPRPASERYVMEGIETVRRLFPRFYFDRKRCAPLLLALRNYHESAGHPVKDGNDHWADMVRTMAMAHSDWRPGVQQQYAVRRSDPLTGRPTPGIRDVTPSTGRPGGYQVRSSGGA